MAVAHIESVTALRGTARVERDAFRTVVWIGGEHDISTVTELAATIARAVAVDETDLVLDLSGLQFMDAATISVIVRARSFLAPKSRTVRLRSPSTATRRTLEICGLTDLVYPRSLRNSAKP